MNPYKFSKVCVSVVGGDVEPAKSLIDANLLHVEPHSFIKTRAGEASGLLKKMHSTSAKSRLNMTRARFAHSDEGSRPNSTADSNHSRK